MLKANNINAQSIALFVNCCIIFKFHHFRLEEYNISLNSWLYPGFWVKKSFNMTSMVLGNVC